MIDVAGGNILRLGEQSARLRPRAVLGVSDVADHGMERVDVYVIGKFLVIETMDAGDSLSQHLSRRVTERDVSVADRVNLFALGPCLVSLEDIGHTREIESRYRCEAFHDHDAVKHRTELHFDRSDKEADHRAAEHFRR
jgi:hypothetical protein